MSPLQLVDKQSFFLHLYIYIETTCIKQRS